MTLPQSTSGPPQPRGFDPAVGPMLNYPIPEAPSVTQVTCQSAAC